MNRPRGRGDRHFGMTGDPDAGPLEVTGTMLAEARMTIAALAELQDDDGLELPLIPPERMPDFQREWRRRPYFRAMLHAVRDVPEEPTLRNRTLRGLWEMGRSAEWTRGPGGRLPAEFAALAELAG